MVSSTAPADATRCHRLSTVVPGSVTAENTVHELTGGDLAMKLHYLRAVYYFAPSETVEGLTVPHIKEPMFPLLDIYYPAAGRIRRDDAGRPRVRCNDGGVRIVEAILEWTVEEWLRRKEVNSHRRLVPEMVVGPDIHFSPTVFIQFTRFKCGGMAVGLSWAHLLGDAVSASNFINLWGQILSRKVNVKKLDLSLRNEPEKSAREEQSTELPLSVKQAKCVGDFWLPPNTKQMATFSIELTAARLTNLLSQIPTKISTFEVISGLIWQAISKTRAEREPKMVTVCRSCSNERTEVLSNQLKVKTVTTNSSPAKSGLLELAKMLSREAMDEMKTIQEIVDKQSEEMDVVLYGSNLTFVDMESIDFYGLEIKGQKPVYVDYSIHGVGDEGVVLVLQGPEANDGGNKGRVVSFILPEEEISLLQERLENDWGIA
ncbi:Rosmarinate synthase [Platanthera guangdongensis]|uniref:Rosmarinate synthase n=1 Tax=Platanthera guangdongensis TaxID=2320717 RepID=A0ABR2MZI8_9ASPA